jgi:hypothetical protein
VSSCAPGYSVDQLPAVCVDCGFPFRRSYRGLQPDRGDPARVPRRVARDRRRPARPAPAMGNGRPPRVPPNRTPTCSPRPRRRSPAGTAPRWPKSRHRCTPTVTPTTCAPRTHTTSKTTHRSGARRISAAEAKAWAASRRRPPRCRSAHRSCPPPPRPRPQTSPLPTDLEPQVASRNARNSRAILGTGPARTPRRAGPPHTSRTGVQACALSSSSVTRGKNLELRCLLVRRNHRTMLLDQVGNLVGGMPHAFRLPADRGVVRE